MLEVEGLALQTYSAADSDEAMELDRLCVQGRSYRMSFRRSTFHKRASNYPAWQIFTGRMAGRLVGVHAAAIKEVVVGGESMPAAFFFDARVHPEFRGRGIGTRVAGEAFAWGMARARFGYVYTLDDNRIAAHTAQSFGGRPAGGFSYLVYPSYRRMPVATRVAGVAFEEAHTAMLSVCGPRDLYSRPACPPGSGGYVSSWLVRRGKEIAGCSAWSNRGILGEVVEAVPTHVRIAGALARGAAPFIQLPHIPQPGEELKSWYVFDFFATDPLLARELMRHVANSAIENGLDYCYVPHLPRDPWLSAVRSDTPRILSPIISYRLLMSPFVGTPLRADRLYVDVRDL